MVCLAMTQGQSFYFTFTVTNSLRWIESILYTLHAFCVLELGMKPI